MNGDIEVIPRIDKGVLGVILNRMEEGKAIATIPIQGYTFRDFQKQVCKALTDFDLMGPYMNPDRSTGIVVVTDPNVQRILTLTYLRMRYEEYIRCTPHEDKNYELHSRKLVDEVELEEVNRFLAPAGLEIQCEEPLHTIFNKPEQASTEVMYQMLPYSSEYFRHVSECIYRHFVAPRNRQVDDSMGDQSNNTDTDNDNPSVGQDTTPKMKDDAKSHDHDQSD